MSELAYPTAFRHVKVIGDICGMKTRVQVARWDGAKLTLTVEDWIKALEHMAHVGGLEKGCVAGKGIDARGIEGGDPKES